jgi:hypothetical protein
MPGIFFALVKAERGARARHALSWFEFTDLIKGRSDDE